MDEKQCSHDNLLLTLIYQNVLQVYKELLSVPVMVEHQDNHY